MLGSAIQSMGNYQLKRFFLFVKIWVADVEPVLEQ